MIYQKEIELPGFKRGFHLISDIVLKELAFIPESGLLNLFLQHTSAALCLNENADPDVRTDFETFISRLIPENKSLYTHTLEGSDDMPAHIRAVLTQTQLSIPVQAGRMQLGVWQGIYLFEHRRAVHRREVAGHLIGE